MITPTPGSAEAHEAGCECPRIDNHYGRGYGGDGAKYGWIVEAYCPVHCYSADEPANSTTNEKEKT